MLRTNYSRRSAAGSIATATVRWRSCHQALHRGLVLEGQLALHVRHGFHCFLVDRDETGNELLDVLGENMYCPGVRKNLSSNEEVVPPTQDAQQSSVTSLLLLLAKQLVRAYWIEDGRSFPAPCSPFAMLFFKLTESIAMAIPGKSHLSLCPAASRKAVLWIPEEDAMRKASALRMEKLVESHDAQAEFFGA